MNNASQTSIIHLNDCGCCEGVKRKTPIEIDNRPGLQSIAYRIGQHPDFKASMLARLSSSEFPNLKDLHTRNDHDFSIALLDAWSSVADVLTFYDQYIANECFLRTATERLSIFELARLIGYKPHPGVAASTLLAFTMDEIPGSPEKITLSTGTKIQSTPKQDEQAQIFETVDQIEARPAWNNIRPRLTMTQTLVSGTRELVFDGIDTELKTGDGVVFTARDASRNVFAIITSVELEQESDRTRVAISSIPSKAIHGSKSIRENELENEPSHPTVDYLGTNFSAADLEAEAKTQNFKIQDIFDALSVNVASQSSALVFRQVASTFGHNAPAWESLPESLKGDVPVFKTGGFADRVVIDKFIAGPYKYDKDVWPGGKNGTLDNMKLQDCPSGKKPMMAIVVTGLVPQSASGPTLGFGIDNSETSSPTFENRSASAANFMETNHTPPTWLFLDNVYKGTSSNDKIVLKDENTWGIYEILAVTELTKSCFAITAKVTRLSLDSAERFEDFSIRGTSVYLQSEQLPLAEVPIENTVPVGDSQTLELNTFVNGLYEGQQAVLSGLEVGGTENLLSEFITLEKVEHKLRLGGATQITFSPALKHVYKRETVTINANVAPATHGETVQEVLGAGDATQTYQTFVLKQPPLTHVSAPTPSGEESTLNVRVNDLLWHETESFFGKGPEDRSFVTRTDDAGHTIVKFGNGDTGTRLPTGLENVRAVYRKGIGTQGLVDSGQLNMLMSRPLGLKEATNPHTPTGAADPESHNDAQRNAPLTVLTLERTVSLLDYEDFCRAFAGIAKAMAVSTTTSQGKTVLITVAGPDGAQIAEDSPVYENLLLALAKAGDPLARFRVRSYHPVTFRLGSKVKIDPDFIAEKVFAEVEAALRASFGFDRREFGQPVALSEVIAIMQAQPGVVAVDVDLLYRGRRRKLESRILADFPGKKSRIQMRAAELLTLHPGPLNHLELMT